MQRRNAARGIRARNRIRRLIDRARETAHCADLNRRNRGLAFGRGRRADEIDIELAVGHHRAEQARVSNVAPACRNPQVQIIEHQIVFERHLHHALGGAVVLNLREMQQHFIRSVRHVEEIIQRIAAALGLIEHRVARVGDGRSRRAKLARVRMAPTARGVSLIREKNFARG